MMMSSLSFIQFVVLDFLDQYFHLGWIDLRYFARVPIKNSIPPCFTCA